MTPLPLSIAIALAVLTFIAGGLSTAWILAVVALVRHTEEDKK